MNPKIRRKISQTLTVVIPCTIGMIVATHLADPIVGITTAIVQAVMFTYIINR